MSEEKDYRLTKCLNSISTYIGKHVVKLVFKFGDLSMNIIVMNVENFKFLGKYSIF